MEETPHLITTPEALEMLRLTVKEKPDGYTYAKPEDSLHCVYYSVTSATPMCIIGDLLHHQLEVPLRDLITVNAAGFDSDKMFETLTRNEVLFTRRAREMLQFAQNLQDLGLPWDQVLVLIEGLHDPEANEDHNFLFNAPISATTVNLHLRGLLGEAIEWTCRVCELFPEVTSSHGSHGIKATKEVEACAAES